MESASPTFQSLQAAGKLPEELLRLPVWGEPFGPWVDHISVINEACRPIFISNERKPLFNERAKL
jgi:hypothetical protein